MEKIIGALVSCKALSLTDEQSLKLRALQTFIKRYPQKAKALSEEGAVLTFWRRKRESGVDYEVRISLQKKKEETAEDAEKKMFKQLRLRYNTLENELNALHTQRLTADSISRINAINIELTNIEKKLETWKTS